MSKAHPLKKGLLFAGIAAAALAVATAVGLGGHGGGNGGGGQCGPALAKAPASVANYGLAHCEQPLSELGPVYTDHQPANAKRGLASGCPVDRTANNGWKLPKDVLYCFPSLGSARGIWAAMPVSADGRVDPGVTPVFFVQRVGDFVFAFRQEGNLVLRMPVGASILTAKNVRVWKPGSKAWAPTALPNISGLAELNHDFGLYLQRAA